MSYQCEVEERSAQPTLAIRTRASVGSLGAVIGEACDTIDEYVREVGGEYSGPPCVAYYNQDVQDLDVEIGLSVGGALPGRAHIKPSEIPGGQLATCLHTGPYSEVGPTYEALSQWTEETGYVPTGAAYEFYLNDPGETPQEELQTLIAFPVRA